MNTPEDKLMKFYQENGILELSKVTGQSIYKLNQILDLEYKTFEDIDFERNEDLNGVVGRIMFDNGYGASVVSHTFSYGGKDGLYELAVLKNGDLHYDNPVAEGDVRGYLTEEEVNDLLIQIQQL